MLGSSLKCARFPYGKTGRHARAINVFGNMLPRFVGVLVGRAKILRDRHPQRTVEKNLET